MEFPTFAGKYSKLLERPNSTGRLPITDKELAARGWTLASKQYLLRQQAMGGKLILAVPFWSNKAACPSRLSVRVKWEADLDRLFNQEGRNRGLVWVKKVSTSEEVLAEASHFYLHAVSHAGRFFPEAYQI